VTATVTGGQLSASYTGAAGGTAAVSNNAVTASAALNTQTSAVLMASALPSGYASLTSTTSQSISGSSVTATLTSTQMTASNTGTTGSSLVTNNLMRASAVGNTATSTVGTATSGFSSRR
jgi:hypothetical protein